MPRKLLYAAVLILAMGGVFWFATEPERLAAATLAGVQPGDPDRGERILHRWLAGARALEGEGSVPNITPREDGLSSWSPGDIVYYFETGFTPDFDSVGGAMVAVQENLAKLPAEDREAIAAYLKAVPIRASGEQ